MEVADTLRGLKDVLPSLTDGVRSFVRSQAAFSYILPDFSAELRHLIAGFVFLNNATSILARTVQQAGGVGQFVGGLFGGLRPEATAQAAAGAAAGSAPAESVTVGGVKLTTQQVAALTGQSPAFAEAVGSAGGAGAAAGTEAGAGAVAATAAGAGLASVAVAGAVVVAALAVAGLAIKSFAQAVLDANRGLAEFSGAMASVFAESDVRDIQRSMKAGEEQAGSARFLAEGLSDLKDTLQPIGTLLANVLNLVGGVLVRVLNVLLKPLSLIASLLNPILDALAQLLEYLGMQLEGGDAAEESVAFGEWLDDIAKISRTAQQRKDPRFRYG